VARYGPKIDYWCRKYGLQQSDAEDVTQEVLKKLYQVLPKFPYDPAKGSFRRWLKTLTHHAWFDYVESQKKAGTGTGDSAEMKRLCTLGARKELVETLGETFDLELYQEALRRALSRSTDHEGTIFQALVFDGRNVQDVADEQGISAGAVRAAKHRVMIRIREEKQLLDRPDSSADEEKP
jgi:RNA polymerase sigma-70 factor (ECF subfamily)